MEQVAKDLINGDAVTFPKYSEIKKKRFGIFDFMRRRIMDIQIEDVVGAEKIKQNQKNIAWQNEE